MFPVRHLSCRIIADAVIRPTPRLGRAALGCRYTWSFNPSGVRLPVSPPGPVSSYLTFSPLTRRAGLFFSVTLLYPFGYLPVRKDGALCCPDFPSRHKCRNDGPACRCKDNQLFRFRRPAIASNEPHLSPGDSPHHSLNELHVLVVIAPINSPPIYSKTVNCFWRHGSKLTQAISVTL